MLIPRDYQEESSDIAVDNLKGKGKGLLVLPCGSGKTLAFSLIAHKLQSKLLVVAHSQDLVEQNYEAALEMGVEDCAIYCAGLKKKDIATVTFITVKSAKANPELFEEFDYAVIDEADFSFSTSVDGEYHKFFKAIGLKNYCGFTATPLTTKRYMDGSMIKVITRIRPSNFKDIIYHLPTQHMVDNGYWTKVNYVVYDFDESLLEYNTTGNDFTDVSVRKAITELSINNNAYIATKKLLNEGKKDILLYCSSLDDAEIFQRNLQDSEIISSKTKQKDRDRIHSEFREGKIRCLISLDTLKAGYNNKKVKYEVIARCYGSIRDWLQVVGRVQRVHPDKKEAFVLDFGGNFARFGAIEDIDINKDITGDWELYKNDILLSGIYHNEIGNYKVIKGSVVQIKSKWLERPDESFANYTMDIGKYRGKPLKSVPKYYLKWCVENLDVCPEEVRKYVGVLR